jgi:Uncharacterized protein conserved in bacteria
MSRIHYKKYKNITLLARQLRKDPTPSEAKLWIILRKKGLSGYKFLRQHPVFYRINKEWIEFFVADFYCSKLKLIIELDGQIHETQKDYDNERGAKLLERGFRVERIKNEELIDLNLILSRLTEVIKSQMVYISDKKKVAPLPLDLREGVGGWVKKNSQEFRSE